MTPEPLFTDIHCRTRHWNQGMDEWLHLHKTLYVFIHGFFLPLNRFWSWYMCEIDNIPHETSIRVSIPRFHLIKAPPTPTPTNRHPSPENCKKILHTHSQIITPKQAYCISFDDQILYRMEPGTFKPLYFMSTFAYLVLQAILYMHQLTLGVRVLNTVYYDGRFVSFVWHFIWKFWSVCHMNFEWNTYENHGHFDISHIITYEFHMKFTWTSLEIHM